MKHFAIFSQFKNFLLELLKAKRVLKEIVGFFRFLSFPIQKRAQRVRRFTAQFKRYKSLMRRRNHLWD